MRVAGVDKARVVVAVGAYDFGDGVSHADHADGDTAADALAAGEEVGLEAEYRCPSSVYGELHVGLIDDEHGAGRADVGVERGDELLRGQHQPTVCQCRLDHDSGDIPARQASAERLGVVVGKDIGRLRGGGVETGEVALHAAVVAARPEGLVEVAVVLAVEHEDRGPPGGHARDANRVGVRTGRREGELPLGEAEALGEQPAHLDCIGGREQEVVAQQ